MTCLINSDIEEIVENISEISILLENKKVLISGGMGFLGRYFLEVFNYLNQEIFEKPVKVFVFDNLITSNKFNVDQYQFPYFEFINQDVSKPFKFKGKLDFIIHAAGIASPYHYKKYPIETIEVAVLGSINLLEMAKQKNAKYLFFSSSEIYGNVDGNQIPIKEIHEGKLSCQGPRACYRESKRLGETLSYLYDAKKLCHTNIVRIFNIYGPGMEGNDYRVIPNFARRIKYNLPLEIYGNGNQTRSFCYVTDAINGFFKILLNGAEGQTYNIGNSYPEISIKKLVYLIEKLIRKKLKYNIVDIPKYYPCDDTFRRSPDISKSQIELGYLPKISLEEGLMRFLNWTEIHY